jgi:hypothetical protein
LVSLLMASHHPLRRLSPHQLTGTGVNRIKLAIIAVTLCLLPIVPHFVLFLLCFCLSYMDLIRAAGAHLIGRQRQQGGSSRRSAPSSDAAHKTE